MYYRVIYQVLSTTKQSAHSTPKYSISLWKTPGFLSAKTAQVVMGELYILFWSMLGWLKRSTVDRLIGKSMGKIDWVDGKLWIVHFNGDVWVDGFVSRKSPWKVKSLITFGESQYTKHVIVLRHLYHVLWAAGCGFHIFHHWDEYLKDLKETLPNCVFFPPLPQWYGITLQQNPGRYG